MIDSTFSTYKMLLVCTFLYIFRAYLVLDNHLVCSSQEATISLVLSIPHFSEVLCNLKHINAMIFNEAKLWGIFLGHTKLQYPPDHFLGVPCSVRVSIHFSLSFQFFDLPSAKFPTLAFLETGLAFSLCQSCRDRWACSLKVKVNEVLILWVWWPRTGDRWLTTAVKRALCVLWHKIPKNFWNWSKFCFAFAWDSEIVLFSLYISPFSYINLQ